MGLARTKIAYNANNIMIPIKIQIDPRGIISYASYYVYGMKCAWPSVKLQWKVIEELPIVGGPDFREGIATIVTYDSGETKKVFIASNDPSTINEKFYNWADVLAKINLSYADNDREKVLAIAPALALEYGHR